MTVSLKRVQILSYDYRKCAFINYACDGPFTR